MIFRVEKKIYDSFSESEKRIVEYINTNYGNVLNLSITQLAAKTFTSPATVSRTIQKSGFSGINDLRNKIEQQTNEKESLSAPYVVDNILAKTFRECTITMDSINPITIYKLIEIMKTSRRIFIYARGFTTLIAEDLQMHLQLQGYDAVIVKDVMWMKNTSQIVTKEDLVIIITVRNSTPELLESAQIAKKIGSTIALISCIKDSNIEQFSDLIILGHSEKIMDIHGLTVYSKIPLLVITRTIMEYISVYEND